jgi:hypothetical protein
VDIGAVAGDVLAERRGRRKVERMHVIRIVVPRVTTAAALLFALGCNDAAMGPPPPAELAVAPTVLWGMGELTLTSPAFRDVVLVPQAGPDGFFDVPNRWSNFTVLLGGDTLDSWRADDSTIVAAETGGRWGLGRPSGEYTVSAVIAGRRSIERALPLIGVRDDDAGAWMYDEFPVPDSWSAPLPWGAGRLLALARHEDWHRGLARIDLNTRRIWWVGDFRSQALSMRLEGIGPSHAPDRIVLDSSGVGNKPRSYRVGAVLEDERPLTCNRPNASGYYYAYMAAEVRPGQCLSWLATGSERGIWADGTVKLADLPDSYYYLPVFLMSPAGDITIPVQTDCYVPVDGGWWVFDSMPAVSYRLPDVGCVSGAAFSPDGDTLFLAARDTTEDYRNTVWSVQARRAGDGGMIRSAAVAGAEGTAALRAVLLDPLRPWIYVAGESVGGGGVLLVIDRESLSILAKVPGIGWIADSRTLVFGGSNGLVFAYATIGGEWVWYRAFDTPARYPP